MKILFLTCSFDIFLMIEDMNKDDEKLASAVTFIPAEGAVSI